jgi:hypothetical protein
MVSVSISGRQASPRARVSLPPTASLANEVGMAGFSMAGFSMEGSSVQQLRPAVVLRHRLGSYDDISIPGHLAATSLRVWAFQ